MLLLHLLSSLVNVKISSLLYQNYIYWFMCQFCDFVFIYVVKNLNYHSNSLIPLF